ncbi:MAG: invasion associated locus B family protein [Rhodobacteraceae bacterium]|jgi:invasion protein IalB|nr:invasion associated locus B family protein [Paracoccaceae bacterium]
MTHFPIFSLPAGLALALGLSLAGAGLAQDQGGDGGTQPADVLSPDALALGEEVTDDPAYLAATHGDWQLVCLRTEEGDDPCELQQLLSDAEGNPVARVNLFPLPAGRQAAAGATIVTPLETLLTEQITIRVDTGQAKRYPFTWCAPVGCIARVGFTAAEIEAFRRGRAASVTIVAVAAPDQPVTLTMSLAGFTAGYDALRATLPAQQ